MQKLGEKRLILHLNQVISELPPGLDAYNLELKNSGADLVYTYDTQQENSDITALLDAIESAGLGFNDLETQQNSLEEIFVNLVKK
jgi:ABC-2 type transport system ATP-binding protein